MSKFHCTQFSAASALLFILLLLTSSITYSQPAQRIIIHFHQALDKPQLINIHSELNRYIPINYEIIKTSNNLSWIIIFSEKLEKQQIKDISQNLLNNALISNIEADKLLEKNTFPSTT